MVDGIELITVIITRKNVSVNAAWPTGARHLYFLARDNGTKISFPDSKVMQVTMEDILFMKLQGFLVMAANPEWIYQQDGDFILDYDKINVIKTSSV